jgi:hypothetical protein
MKKKREKMGKKWKNNIKIKRKNKKKKNVLFFVREKSAGNPVAHARTRVIAQLPFAHVDVITSGRSTPTHLVV